MLLPLYLLWKLVNLIYWQASSNLIWARKSRGNKSIKEREQKILAASITTEKQTIWIQGVQKCQHPGSLSPACFCSKPDRMIHTLVTSWAYSHWSPFEYNGGNDAFLTGQVTEIGNDMCTGPAHRRPLINVGSHSPHFSQITTQFKSPDQVLQPQREVHRGTAGVGAP